MKKIPLRWKINPSSPENFYENEKIYEEFSNGKDVARNDRCSFCWCF